MHSMQIHNTRYCPNRACTVVIFRKIVINVCPRCETPGVIVESMKIGLKREENGA